MLNRSYSSLQEEMEAEMNARADFIAILKAEHHDPLADLSPEELSEDCIDDDFYDGDDVFEEFRFINY